MNNNYNTNNTNTNYQIDPRLAPPTLRSVPTLRERYEAPSSPVRHLKEMIAQDFFKSNYSKISTLYNEHHNDNARMEAYDDLLQYEEEERRHNELASFSQPQSSLPSQEDWRNGPPLYADYTEVSLPLHLFASHGLSVFGSVREFVSQVIGNQGYWLKQITHETGVHYIYFNYNPTGENPLPYGVFQIWGPRDRLAHAENQLCCQMQFILDKMATR